MALRRQLSLVLPLSNDELLRFTCYIRLPGCSSDLKQKDLRQPGNHGWFPSFRPYGFASPAFTGFTFIEPLLDIIIQGLLKMSIIFFVNLETTRQICGSKCVYCNE